tara:strand:+ start:369 stop:536 length:168 start_codon:yes stop_codon:yes gene_type:complete
MIEYLEIENFVKTRLISGSETLLKQDFEDYQEELSSIIEIISVLPVFEYIEIVKT